MDCPCRWAVLYTVIFFITQTANVYCQVAQIEERPTQYETKDIKRDVSKYYNPSPKTIGDTFFTNIQDDRQKTVQIPSCYSQDPTLFGQTASGNILTPELIPCNGRIPLENYATTNQPSSVWQVTQPTNDVSNYPPVNLQMNPSSTILPTINTQSGISELLSEISRGVFQEPIMLKNGYEDGIPVHLQINVPSQNVPAPRITVVSATPPSVTSANSEAITPFPQFGFLPPPAPIVRKKSRCWKSLLPILLLTLLSDQGSCGNGCCCPCNCCCNSDSPIPIPYPIPIPVNSPIINNHKSSCSSRKRGHRDNEDDDDEDN